MATHNKQPVNTSLPWFEDIALQDDPFQNLGNGSNAKYSATVGPHTPHSLSAVVEPSKDTFSAKSAMRLSTPTVSRISADGQAPQHMAANRNKSIYPSETAQATTQTRIAGDASALFTGDNSGDNLFYTLADAKDNATPSTDDFLLGQQGLPSTPSDQFGKQTSTTFGDAYDYSATHLIYDTSAHISTHPYGQYDPHYQTTNQTVIYDSQQEAQYSYTNYQYSDQPLHDQHIPDFYSNQQHAAQYKQPYQGPQGSFAEYQHPRQQQQEQHYASQYEAVTDYQQNYAVDQLDASAANDPGIHQYQTSYPYDGVPHYQDQYDAYQSMYQPENQQWQYTGTYDPYTPQGQVQTKDNAPSVEQQPDREQSNDHRYTPIQQPLLEATHSQPKVQSYGYDQLYTAQSVDQHEHPQQTYVPEHKRNQQTRGQKSVEPHPFYGYNAKDAYVPQDGHDADQKDQIVPHSGCNAAIQPNVNDAYHDGFNQRGASNYSFLSSHAKSNGLHSKIQAPHETAKFLPFSEQTRDAKGLDHGTDTARRMLEPHKATLNQVPTLHVEARGVEESKQSGTHYSGTHEKMLTRDIHDNENIVSGAFDNGFQQKQFSHIDPSSYTQKRLQVPFKSASPSFQPQNNQAYPETADKIRDRSTGLQRNQHGFDGATSVDPKDATKGHVHRQQERVVPSSAPSYDPSVYSTSRAAHTSSARRSDTQTTYTPAMSSVPSRPASANEALHSTFAGRSPQHHLMERSTTLPVRSERLPSPHPESLLPCPDPNCEGENKAKAKFCCECGRPLTSLSRVTTPAGAVSTPLLHPHTLSTNTYNTAHLDVPKPIEMYMPDQDHMNDVTGGLGVRMDGFHGGDYYPSHVVGADMYEPSVPSQGLPPDPLHRTKGCPLISFGFGGKFCIMFPQRVQRFINHGASAPITKTMPSAIHIKKLKDVLGEQHPMVTPLSQFVGPVLFDSKHGAKAKQKEVLAYIDKRVTDLSNSPVAFHPFGQQRILLFQLIKTMIENDGVVGEGDKLDNAICALIRPPMEREDEQGSFSVPAFAQPQDIEYVNDEKEVEERSKRVLDKLQTYLLHGDRAAAVNYAMQEDMWPHALIISSCVNKELWMTVVTSFVERELSGSAKDRAHQVQMYAAGDRQALRVLYCLLAGTGGSSISEFMQQGAWQQRPSGPFGPTPTLASSDEQLEQWRLTLTLILANRTERDSEAITGLGDTLRAHGWIGAAHICYLLSPQTSIHSGIDDPRARLTLIGADGPNACSDLDAYFLAELFEFALASKQGDPPSLPFLQGFKLVHAWRLADLGYLAEAHRYCEAIANAIKVYSKASPYLHRQLFESLKELSELCEVSCGQSLGADSGSWLKAKLTKGSLDSLWGSLEGKFNKFVSGEDDPVPEEPQVRKSTEIMGNPHESLSDVPPARSASAFDFRNAGHTHNAVESIRRTATPTTSMASTEMYDSRQSLSPGPRSSDASSNTFSPMAANQPHVRNHMQATGRDRQPAFGYGAQPPNASVSPFRSGAASAAFVTDQAQTRGGDGWYDQYSRPSTSSTADTRAEGSYGLQSVYGGQSVYGNPSPGSTDIQQQMHSENANTVAYGQDDDDDLGFGNSALTKQKPANITEKNTTPDGTGAPGTDDSTGTKASGIGDGDKKQGMPDLKNSGGWLRSLFSRSVTPSNEKKPIKANLGEESSFYYDEKEKRWVSKKAGVPPAAPPFPPPPKGKTSSPPPPSSSVTRMAPTSVTQPRQATPPVVAKAPPTNGVVNTTVPSSPALSSTATSPPTSSGTRRSGGRKPMRSRYVDVFNA